MFGSSSIVNPNSSSTPGADTLIGFSGSSGFGRYSNAGEIPVSNDDANTGLKVSKPVAPNASIARS